MCRHFDQAFQIGFHSAENQIQKPFGRVKQTAMANHLFGPN
jgi:hypothetical protein